MINNVIKIRDVCHFVLHIINNSLGIKLKNRHYAIGDLEPSHGEE